MPTNGSVSRREAADAEVHCPVRPAELLLPASEPGESAPETAQPYPDGMVDIVRVSSVNPEP